MRLILFILATHISVLAREQNPSAVVLISIPKCGTHLLKKCIQLISDGIYVSMSSLGTSNRSINSIIGPKGQHPCVSITPAMSTYLKKLDATTKILIDASSIAHLPYTKENAKVLKNPKLANFLMIRDPRDQIVSFVHWKKRKSNILYPVTVRELDFDTLCLDLINEGKSNYPVWRCNIVDFYSMYLSWMKLDNFCLVRFESLVGPHGGGSRREQLKEIKKIARHMGIVLGDNQAMKIALDLFGGTTTFRSGQIGTWRGELKSQHINAFKAIPGALQLLVDLGYEKDFSWVKKFRFP